MTALALIGGLLLFLALGVARSILADEAKGWIRDLGLLMVRRAAQHLPPPYQEEKQSEWEGEFLEQASKPISSLMWSWRLFRSRHSTAHEMRVFGDGSAPFKDSEPITLQSHSDEMPPYLRSLVDGFHAYGWQSVVSAMQDATLGHIDERINAATARFFSVVDEARAVSIAPLPRFGPPPGSYAWDDIYNPEPPKLRPSFQIYTNLRQEVIPPRESWPVRLLRSFLALDLRFRLIAALTATMLVAGMPFWLSVGLAALGLSVAMASTRRRLGMLLAYGIVVLYAQYLWPLAMAHGVFGFEEGRVLWWVLYGAAIMTLAPTAIMTKVFRFARGRNSYCP